MIQMATNNFFAPTPILMRENYHIWVIKMNTYLKCLSLWKFV